MTVLADAGFLVALLSRADHWHGWALAQVPRLTRPWITCEAVLTEVFHILDCADHHRLRELLRRGVLMVRFDFGADLSAVLDLMEKYEDLPTSLADACLVRMSEIQADPLVVTTDSHFAVYRRHSRQVIPCLAP